MKGCAGSDARHPFIRARAPTPVMADIKLTPEQVKAFGGPEVRPLTPTAAAEAAPAAAAPAAAADGPSMAFKDRWNEPGAAGASKNAGGPSWGLAGKFK